MTDERNTSDPQMVTRRPDHPDRLNGVAFALILIWAGVILLAHNIGVLDDLARPFDLPSLPVPDLPWSEIPFLSASAWRVFFLGAAAIALLEVLIRLLVPAFRRRLLGSVIGAVVLVAVGLGRWGMIFPLVLIAVGASILLSGVLKRRDL